MMSYGDAVTDPRREARRAWHRRQCEGTLLRPVPADALDELTHRTRRQPHHLRAKIANIASAVFAIHAVLTTQLGIEGLRELRSVGRERCRIQSNS